MGTAETRGKLVDAALVCFAEKGFYGASIASIADTLGLTKQALLHHFGTKEKLYGEVLQRVSNRFDTLVAEAGMSNGGPEDELERFLARLHTEATSRSDESRLLLRELLDNKRRAKRAERWYLKGFLDKLVEMVRRTERWRGVSEARAFAVAYQLLGAVIYFSVSEPTIAKMYGRGAYQERLAEFPGALSSLARSVLYGDAPG